MTTQSITPSVPLTHRLDLWPLRLEASKEIPSSFSVAQQMASGCNTLHHLIEAHVEMLSLCTLNFFLPRPHPNIYPLFHQTFYWAWLLACVETNWTEWTNKLWRASFNTVSSPAYGLKEFAWPVISASSLICLLMFGRAWRPLWIKDNPLKTLFFPVLRELPLSDVRGNLLNQSGRQQTKPNKVLWI